MKQQAAQLNSKDEDLKQLATRVNQNKPEEEKKKPATQTSVLSMKLRMARNAAAANLCSNSSKIADLNSMEEQNIDNGQQKADEAPALKTDDASNAIPYDMVIREEKGKFRVREGRVRGLLYQSDQEGNNKDRLIWSEYYRCDTVKKEFGEIKDDNDTWKYKLKPNFQVDDKIMNPVKYEFIINGAHVYVPNRHRYPFAILNSGRVQVFWAATAEQRTLWVKALRVLAGPEAANLGEEIIEQNQIVITKRNFFSAQVYMFMKREYQYQTEMTAQN